MCKNCVRRGLAKGWGQLLLVANARGSQARHKERAGVRPRPPFQSVSAPLGGGGERELPGQLLIDVGVPRPLQHGGQGRSTTGVTVNSHGRRVLLVGLL